MHKTLFFSPFIYLKLNLTKSVLSEHYIWVMLFVRKEHWLKRYGSAGSSSALWERPQWQSARVRVDNETINCFHECFEFGLLWGKFKRYLVPHFTYVSNARRCNISSKSRIFSELTWATVVGLLTGLHSWRETRRHTMLLLEGRSSSQHCPAVGRIQSGAKIPTSEVGLWWWMGVVCLILEEVLQIRAELVNKFSRGKWLLGFMGGKDGVKWFMAQRDDFS